MVLKLERLATAAGWATSAIFCGWRETPAVNDDRRRFTRGSLNAS